MFKNPGGGVVTMQFPRPMMLRLVIVVTDPVQYFLLYINVFLAGNPDNPIVKRLENARQFLYFTLLLREKHSSVE
jgi:hypothetical protein